MIKMTLIRCKGEYYVSHFVLAFEIRPTGVIMSFILRTAALSLFFINTAFAAININTADSSSLQKFNGVGPSTAQKIIDYRDANGEFTSCDQLTNVKGIGSATLTKIKPDCIVKDGEEPSASSSSASTSSAGGGSGSINVNTASASELQKFNGVGPSTAQKIIDYRDANGEFTSCDQLTKVKGIGDGTLAKIKPDCTVGEVKKK